MPTPKGNETASEKRARQKRMDDDYRLVRVHHWFDKPYNGQHREAAFLHDAIGILIDDLLQRNSTLTP